MRTHCLAVHRRGAALAALTLAACAAPARGTPGGAAGGRPQGAAADSAAVFALAVDDLLEAHHEPFRLGAVPRAAWAAPAVARLRARATTDTAAAPLSLALRFAGDKAWAVESDVRCRPGGGHYGGEVERRYERVAGAWRRAFGATITLVDGVCFRPPAR